MADSLISGLLEQLASITAREVDQKIRLVVGVDEEVQRLKGNLQTVRAVLDDAEKRQAECAVGLWLEKLKEVSYEMDDVLDEWNTEMIKLEIEKKVEDENAENNTNAKKCFIPCTSCCFRQVNELVMRHNIARKIEELNRKLDEITKERETYGFKLNKGTAQIFIERPKTTSFVDVSEIFGRDKDRDYLVSILLGEGSQKEEMSPQGSQKEEMSTQVISLVGMSGIGKTTLAQLAYNNPKVNAYFQKRIWVCVSEPFDQCNVAKAIIQALTGENPNITELQILLEKICKLIKKMKFFLILDDMVIEDDKMWVPFKEAFKNGSQDSRIIVTTRNKRVANKIGSVEIIDLEFLSEEDCWLMFRKIAFSGKDPTLREQLENLGREIARKCKGLPLAAKTLGSLLRFKDREEEWKSVLDSNLWELEDVEIKSLFAPLLLSYYDLPSPLKLCLSYCAVFPKDYVFSRDELAYMWMAQGYIMPNTNLEMKIMAREYLEKLALHYFFQKFEKDEDDGKIRRYKMHDIVHYFAQLISKNVGFTINSDIKLGLDYKTVRHLHLEISKEAEFPKSLYSAENLRTLIFVFQGNYNKLSTLFKHFKFLRTLYLKCNEDGGLLKEIPDVVGNFIHLRYLNLVNCHGNALPETICNLCNLQILNIKIDGKEFPKLPQGMSKLINLRHFNLDFPHNSLRVKFPKRFGRLTSLRTLNYFSVSGKGDSERCTLEELTNLNHLQGTLKITGLGEVHALEAQNVQLKRKEGLRTLSLWFEEWDVDEEIIREKDAAVLNALEPPPNLDYLEIGRYQGSTMFPNWMMHLNNLKKLHICFFTLEHLPPLGKLPFLELLDISRMNRLKEVGVEFMGIEEFEKKNKDGIKLFPNLISLLFFNLPEWEKWNGIGEEECIRFTIMPRLQHLKLNFCQKLKSLPNFLHRIPLQKLEIIKSPILEECCKKEGSEWSKICHIPNIRYTESLWR